MPWAKSQPDSYPSSDGPGPTGNKGFTLIEVLISLVVLGIGLLSVAAMQISSIEGNSGANHITRATVVVENRLDVYKSMDYAAIQNGSGTDGIYTWTTTVQANVPVNKLKTVTVDVSWKIGGRNHSISFGTIIADDT